MITNKSKWIWYPGDFEIWMGNIFHNRRTERGAIFPPFWKQDSHYPMVEFSTKTNLKKSEQISIYVEGEYNVAIDGVKEFGMPEFVTIPEGEHSLNIKVVNQSTPPAIYVSGETIFSNSDWLVTYEDKIWIDENGVAHGSGVYVPAACWNFDAPDTPPSSFKLSLRKELPVGKKVLSANAVLYDFGKETFGYLVLENIIGKGVVGIYYGESAEEAQDKDYCETLDRIEIDGSTNTNHTLPNSKAFRYVMLEYGSDVEIGGVSMLYEYLPEEYCGSFRCSDDEINNIWDIAAYTIHLTTREFFMDGIKRDRWVWSGDAVQSFLMNYYLFFDSECVKRTIRLLRGKDPVTAHINTIMDYTFYWFNGIYDYYLYSGDKAFVKEMYPKMKTLMDYCLGRTNKDGMAEGQPDDWIFVDWVDFPMHKRGVMCFEQILFCKSLETMHLCAKICDETVDSERYSILAKSLKETFSKTFWSNEKHAFLHNIEEGNLNDMVTKFPNMFAIIYDYVEEERKKEILKHVMLNKDVEAITTPYMRFYELEALCLMGMQREVLPEIKSYWGGMLKEGATSFWEKYNPYDKGKEHLAMYGRPYGKSLCHAWGASPIYLLGKYYLGVKPLKPGYQEYEVRPSLGGLEWMEGDVPTPFGKIHIKMDRKTISVFSTGGKGRLHVGNITKGIPKNETITINY